jgi:tetratricopeptide (TPR) repeat protein
VSPRRAIVALLLVGLASSVRAESTATELIEEAVASYARAMDTQERDARLELFRHAERRFSQVIARGHRNPDLYANLGNAALQTERLGPAILAYRRALRLDPDHPRALQNLEHARTLLPHWVPRPESGGVLDTFFFWHRTLSRGDRNLAAALAFAATALLIALAIRLGSTTPRNLALLPALAWLALLASLWLDPASRAKDEAVVTSDEVSARAADSALAPTLFPAALPGGTEVRIVETRSPWLRIRLANGRDVWVPESSTTRTGEPS